MFPKSGIFNSTIVQSKVVAHGPFGKYSSITLILSHPRESCPKELSPINNMYTDTP